jgi:hypothetical protein
MQELQFGFKGNLKMKKLSAMLIFLTGFVLVFSQGETLSRKEKKELSRIFPGELDIQHLDLAGQIQSVDSLWKKGDQLFQIELDGEFVGYMLRTRAKGRVDYFDYFLLYTKDLVVSGVSVTIYRSAHGAAICQRKWLKQFEGYRGGELVLGTDIDAISGASISALSMVDDIQRCQILMTRLRDGELIR